MSLPSGEIAEHDGFGKFDAARMLKILTPFFIINIVASFLFLLWPVAIPVFFAEFCLLAVWSAWGPGDFWKRFSSCLIVGGLLFLSQLYLLIVVTSVSTNIRLVFIMVQWLFSAWIVAQIPLWIMRYVWQWRITDEPNHDLHRFSVNDNMIGMTMICVALASCRWATEHLIAIYGPFGFEVAWTFYGFALAEIYVLIAIAGFGTFLAFRLSHFSTRVIPLIVAGFVFAWITAAIWFAAPDRWIAAGVIWVGSIMFAWAILLPASQLRSLGLKMYQGKKEIGFAKQTQATVSDSSDDSHEAATADSTPRQSTTGKLEARPPLPRDLGTRSQALN